MTTSAPLTIGAVDVDIQGTLHWTSGLPQIPAAFSARGQAESWALSVTSGGLTINVGGRNRRDLIPGWETSADALTFVDGADEIVVPGPDATDSETDDDAEPYVWSWPTIGAFRTWINAHKGSAALAVVLSADATAATTVTASAGGDKSVASGGTVQLDGSATVQHGQGATTWAWRRVSGTGGLLDETTPQTPTFHAPVLQPGDPDRTIVYRLTAANNGVADTDEVAITVTAPGAPPPTSTREGVDASRLDAGPIVDLFTVRLQGGGVERYTSGPHGSASVMYGGQAFSPLPITLERADFRSSGAYSRPTLRVSLLDRSAAPADWQGATIERVRTLGRYLDGASEADPERHWPMESWVVDRLSGRGRAELSWQLSSPLDLQLAMIPRRQVLRDVCQWEYRRRAAGAWVNPPADDGCPYRGARFWNARDEPVSSPSQDVCSRRLSGCKLRFGEHGALPFGGFAGVTQLRR